MLTAGILAWGALNVGTAVWLYRRGGRNAAVATPPNGTGPFSR